MNETNLSVISKKLAHRVSKAFVAIADDTKPDITRLSLVACGDISTYGSEHKENFLQRFLKENQDKSHTIHRRFITLPNRYELANIVSEEYLFPLSEVIKIFDTCIRLQHLPDFYQSLIGLTTVYGKGPRAIIKNSYYSKPSIVILVSEKFDIKEATSFWNIRASGTYVAWISFSTLESSLDEVAQWLNSEYVHTVLSVSAGTDIVFSSSKQELSKLLHIVEILQAKKQIEFPQWHSMSYEDTIFYNYDRPSAIEEQVIVVREGNSRFSFIPDMPKDYIAGEWTIVLRWNHFTLPYCSPQFIQSHISSEIVSRLTRAKGIILPKFRVIKDRYLGMQNMSTKPIEFNRPTTSQIINALFADGGFPYIEQSSTAKYHTSFINRCGALTDTAYYLATSPYRELFEALADNSNKNKTGWILDYPSKRRALHHLHLRDVLNETTPAETKSYFNTVSDELPTEAFQLLEKGLLERGFQLSCIACSYKSWYPAEHVGQTFECSRCFQTQVYNANPLWLYKLPEVVFQGFEDNMQVPLLALDYLRRASKHSFEWVPDSNVYTHQEGSKEAYRNIDILCISDGKLYIGEAKSNDIIEADQFSFYEQVCESVAVDGIVFATSQTHWKRGTQQRIDSLKTWFRGEVLVVTEKDLYLNRDNKI